MAIDKLDYGRELRANSIANTKKINEVIDVVNVEASEAELQELQTKVAELSNEVLTDKEKITQLQNDKTAIDKQIYELQVSDTNNKGAIASNKAVIEALRDLEIPAIVTKNQEQDTNITKIQSTIQTILNQITAQTEELILENVYSGFVTRIAGLCIITIHFTGTLAKGATISLPNWANQGEVARSMVFNTITGARICELAGQTITVLNGDIVANNGYTSDLQFVYKPTDSAS